MKNGLFLMLLLAGSLILPNSTFAQAPDDKQIQALEMYMAPLRKKVTDILEADKTGQYRTYKSDLKKIAAESDRRRRRELLLKLDRDHHEFIKKSFNSAVINHEEMKREIARILGHNKFTLGEFGDIRIDIIAPEAALPVRFNKELLCPLTVNDHDESAGGGSECIAQGAVCSSDVQCLAEILGGCRAKTGLGDNFVIPAGTFTKIDVATQTDIAYEGWAFAVGGYGLIHAKYGIRFRASGIDKTVFAREVFAYAPIVWYSHMDGIADNFISNASFNGNFPEGATVTAQAQLEGFALSVPALSLTVLYADTDHIDFIRLSGN